MKHKHYLASFALIVMLSACETTRANNDKPSVRTLICNVPDRCDQTP